MKKVGVRFLFFIILFRLFISYAYGEENLSNNLPNTIYFDADDDIKINRDTGYIELNNNASFLLGDMYVTAKKIIILRNENMITAEGNVRLIYDKEKVVATKIVFDTSTKQLRMDNAKIFSDPAETDEKLAKEVLGLSKAEIAFDVDKLARAKEIEQQLNSARDQYSNLRNLKELKKNDPTIDEKLKLTIARYSQLLARYTRTQYQPNAYLEAIPELEKKRFLKRREHVDKFKRDNPEFVNQVVDFNPINSYIYVSASQIVQKDKKTYILNDAIVTPCRCSSLGEPPIYGFSAQNAKIDIGNYITFQGTTVDIFSLPLFYSPWLKLSIKNKRETGFLYPGAYTSNNAGSAIIVPYFITMGDHADSTITYKNFSTRGSQIQAEFRAQLNEETPKAGELTQFYSMSSYIQDQQYTADYMSNKAKIDSAIQNDPSKASQYENFVGRNFSKRWFTQESASVPLSYWGAFKVNGQFVSDNTYLSDFSSNIIADPTKAVKGDTTPASRRFLAQEVAAEYFGDNIVLSLRTQAQQDLFSQSQANTPMRLPRVEFSLLPNRFLNGPFVFSNNTTWENVVRPGLGKNYIVSNPSTKKIPDQKDFSDTYAQGKRLYSSSKISIPLPANDYVNAYAAVTATGVQYYFSAAEPFGEIKPYQGYLQYVLNADMPIYGKYNFMNKENKVVGSLTQTFIPYVNFTYIPNVVKSMNFPSTYSLWYSQDSLTAPIVTPIGQSLVNNPIATSAYLTVGATTSWTYQKIKYKSQSQLLDRFLQKNAPSVANINYFAQVIGDKQGDIVNHPESLFQYSSKQNANIIFENWAKKELEGYYKDVLNEELNQKYFWPIDSAYDEEVQNFTPISIGLSTNYNFLSAQTALEQNNNAGPLVAPLSAAPFGDIYGTLSWNFDPLLGLNGSIIVDYSQVNRRLSSLTSNVTTILPYNVTLNYSHTVSYKIPPATPPRTDYAEYTTDAAGFAYSPISWINMGFQWSYSTDPGAGAVDTNDGKAYGSAYFINLVGIQNCLDLILARSKPVGIAESQATYSIGLNMQIFGFPTGAQDVGSYLNRKLHN